MQVTVGLLNMNTNLSFSLIITMNALNMLDNQNNFLAKSLVKIIVQE